MLLKGSYDWFLRICFNFFLFIIYATSWSLSFSLEFSKAFELLLYDYLSPIGLISDYGPRADKNVYLASSY
jgi:hypothetical protein